MNKIEFVLALQDQLKGLPKEDLRRSLDYYNEMIDDRMEDGLTEEEAIAAIGPLDEIAKQILEEIPVTTLVKEKLRPKKQLKSWQTILLIAGAPLWVSLLLAAASVVFSVYVSIWSVLVSLYACAVSLVVVGISALPGAAILCIGGNYLSALFYLGGGLVCGGLSIFAFMGCRYAGKGIAWLSKAFGLWIKSLIVGKEAQE